MPNTAPSFSAGRTGHVSLNNRYTGQGDAIARQADGKLLTASSHNVYRFNLDGSTDLSFGNRGHVEPDLFNPTGIHGLNLTEITVLKDGKLLVAGTASARDITAYSTGVSVLRLTPDGKLDASFGDSGTAFTTISKTTWNVTTGMAIAADGSIVVASDSRPLNADGTIDFLSPKKTVLARYLANGKPDTSFGTGGLLVDAEAQSLHARSIAMQADGKLLVLADDDNAKDAFTVIRLNANGSRDTSFGTNGKAQTPFFNDYGLGAQLGDIKIQADGKIVVAGAQQTVRYFPSAESTTLVRYNPDGSLDPTFGNGGIVVQPVYADNGNTQPAGSYASAEVQSLAISDSGKITLVARLQFLQTGISLDELAIMHFNADGSPDGGTGGTPIQTVRMTKLNDFLELNGTIVDSDGSVVVSSSILARDNGAFTSFVELAQVNADGTLAASFGNSAEATLNSAVYRQAYPASAINPNISVADAELATAAANYAGASLTLARHGGANAADSFSASGMLEFKDGQAVLGGVTIGTVKVAAGALRIEFTANATQALVNGALQAIAYQHIGRLTQTETIQLDWTFSDGNTGAQGTGTALSAHAATQLTLMPAELPYWIDALLNRTEPGQTGLQLRAHQQDLLNPDHPLALAFDEQGWSRFSAAEQAQARSLLAGVVAVTGVRTADNGVPLTFHKRADSGLIDFSTQLRANGADIYVAAGADGHAILHEFGQVLGLKDIAGDPAASGLSLMAAGATGASLGVLDIAALQYLYGPNPSVRSGSDMYALKADTNNFVWDGGGNDTISAAGLSQDLTLSLTPGEWSYIGAKADSITAAGQVTINYGTLIENAIGGNGNDRLTGSAGANSLFGGAGNDRLAGMGGGDQLDGGAGIDVTVYAGARADYKLAPGSAGGYTVQAATGGPVDGLVNVERIEFSDATVGIDANTVQAYRMYQAAFDRKPDAAGLGFWINAMDHGMSLKAMAASFMSAPEFIKLYGATPDVTAFVTRLYSNVLHRAPDTDGLAWWKALLDNGTLSYADAMTGFSESPENSAQLIGQTQGGVAFIPYTG